MSDPCAEVVSYKNSRFTTRLPTDRLYVPSHFWLAKQEGETDLYRVGFTKFATRMLGEIVEHGFESKADNAVTVGQTIGWVEGFKAISDLYCVANGTFAGGNPALDTDIAIIDKDPYNAGWLYLVRGTPDPNAVSVDGYIGVLNATIDKMKGQYGE